MAVKIINGKVWDGKRHFFPGETMVGLSEEDESYLISCRVAETEKAPILIQKAEQIEGSKITNMNSKTAIAFVKSVEDIVELNKLGMEETEGKNRATVVNAISERIAGLEASEEANPDEDESDDGDNDDGNSGSEDSDAKLNLQLNPDDMIVK